jgi:DNA-binding transcriptional ArsR family regulator
VKTRSTAPSRTWKPPSKNNSANFWCPNPGESLRLSYEVIAEAALLSPRTVGRAVRRLAGLGLITIHRRHKSDSVFEITPLVEAAR